MIQSILYLINFMSVFRVGKISLTLNLETFDVLKWIRHGKDIHEFVHHFKGKHLDSDVPPKQYLKYASS